jgi:transcriptional regulator with XRE-family HTH domain
MASKGGPDTVDKHVGARLRMRRVELGLSQTDLAVRLGGAKENGKGLTFQQVQKYEKGTNRMGASRLYQAATVLNTPVSYFFEGLPDPRTGKSAIRRQRA